MKFIKYLPFGKTFDLAYDKKSNFYQIYNWIEKIVDWYKKKIDYYKNQYDINIENDYKESFFLFVELYRNFLNDLKREKIDKKDFYLLKYYKNSNTKENYKKIFALYDIVAEVKDGVEHYKDRTKKNLIVILYKKKFQGFTYRFKFRFGKTKKIYFLENFCKAIKPCYTKIEFIQER